MWCLLTLHNIHIKRHQKCSIFHRRSQDSTISIVTGYGLGFNSQQEQEIFLYSTASRLILGPTLPPIQWVLGVLSLGVKQPRHEPHHSPPSSSEIKNVGPIPPLPHMPSWHSAQSIKHRDKFTFIGMPDTQTNIMIYYEMNFLFSTMTFASKF
jgi:hypothetical protein